MVGSRKEEVNCRPHYQDIVETLKSFIIEQSLPLWSNEGWDVLAGGFVEKLDFQGRADTAAIRRVRVHARQIYCFARAADIGWYPQGREMAMKGLEYLLAKAKSPDGRPGFVHLLNPDGSVNSSLRDSYDHAFIVLALSTLYHLSRDSQVGAELYSLMAFVDHDLKSPQGGFIEGIPTAVPRRQNPQMHLFEAMTAAFEATGDALFRDRANDLFRLFASHLYDSKLRVLGEYFREDWSKIEPLIVEPGHQAEWVWLLKGFERMTGSPTAQHREELLASALRYRDDATGCLFDEGDPNGAITKSTRRLWPQTEIAKAWIAQAEAGVQGAREQAYKALARMHRHYLCHPVQGGWYDQFDRDNRSLVDSIPASSFYHILCAVAEADRVLG